MLNAFTNESSQKTARMESFSDYFPIYKPRRSNQQAIVSSTSESTDDGKSFCQRTPLNSTYSAESDTPSLSTKTTKKPRNRLGIFGSASAKNRRSLYALSRKCAQSLPTTESVIDSPQRYSSDFFKQFSLESVAMQNNCTVLNNKVRPVVIKNCKEEYQMRQYQYVSSGKLHEEFSEHELLLDRFFLLKDHFVGIDVHNTMEQQGVPNLKMSTVDSTLYAIGQPTLNGLEKFSAFLSSKYKSVCYINVRAVPTLFLKRSGDFIPYSGYCLDESFKRQMRLTERQLHDCEREMQIQALQIASKNSDMFYFYNVLDQSPDEPHMYYVTSVADLVTSRQMYSKIQSERQNFKYRRLVLHDINIPSFTWMDSLMDIITEMDVVSGESAIVFQGLTGEGPARLAMIMAYIALSVNLETESTSKSKTMRRIQTIQDCYKWIDVVMQQLLESASLNMPNLQFKVDEAIAAASTHVVILAFIKETKRERHESNVELVLGGLSKHFNNVADENNSVPRNEKEELLKVRELPSFKSVALSLSLRDVSELSLPSSHHIESRQGEGNLDEYPPSTNFHFLLKHSSKTPIRYEVCDEVCLLKRLFQRPDLYFYLVLFQAYAIKKAQGLVSKFSEWMVNHPNLVLTLSQAKQYSHTLAKEDIWEMNAKSTETNCETDNSFHRVVGLPIYGMGQALPERFIEVIKSLCGVKAKKRFNRVVFLNLRNEMSFYTLKQNVEQAAELQTNSNGQSSRSPSAESDYVFNTDTLWELQRNAIPAMYGAPSHMIEAVEMQLTDVVNQYPERIVLIGKDLPRDRELFGTVKTTSGVIKQIANLPEVKEVCEHVGYVRIPLPRNRIPNFEFFDQMITTLRDSYHENPDTAFVFFCHNGKKRTANMMAAACLILGHMNDFPSSVKNSLRCTVESWTPDDEFTRGEFKILPDCYISKKEVDTILDLCHESMSTMHYHLRENLNPSYKKISKAKTVEESVTLKHHCIQGLEFYVILIVFNYYLKQEKSDLWRSVSFNEWMSKHGSRLGVCQLLNNFGVMDFNEDEPLNKMQYRWSDTPTLLCNILGEDSVPGRPRKNVKDFRTASMSTESFESSK